MSDPALQVLGLGKRYAVSQSTRRYLTLRESLLEGVRAALSRCVDASERHVWALREVSFGVETGEVVGVIGRNGAGKSTLLRVLSEITDPTEGRVEVRGRVATLLEVGTGFHPELTGRENVFLNGAILGMTRREVTRKFDEIVEFAGVERFLDTPVKRYSTGMFLRLAFAVAAHLEPDILLVDEVLAVGDAGFQRRCLAKMDSVGRSGRTVLFVSHNMNAVTRLCPRAILLDGGRLVADGPSAQVAARYLQSDLGTTAARRWEDGDAAPGNDVVRIRAVSALDDAGVVAEAHDIRREVRLQMEFDVLEDGHVLVPNLHLWNEEGICLFVTHDCDPEWRGRPRPRGRYRSAVTLPGNFLAEGAVSVQAVVSTHDPVIVHADERDAIAFRIVDSLDGNTARGDYAGPMHGVLRPLLPWTNERLAGL